MQKGAADPGSGGAFGSEGQDPRRQGRQLTICFTAPKLPTPWRSCNGASGLLHGRDDELNSLTPTMQGARCAALCLPDRPPDLRPERHRLTVQLHSDEARQELHLIRGPEAIPEQGGSAHATRQAIDGRAVAVSEPRLELRFLRSRAATSAASARGPTASSSLKRRGIDAPPDP